MISCSYKFCYYFAAARGFTFDDLLKTSCPERTFVCPFNGWCCESDSQKCSNMSFTCEDVFLKDEDRDKVCCGVLYKNDTTRKGLLSACINRLGSVTWQSHCKGIQTQHFYYLCSVLDYFFLTSTTYGRLHVEKYKTLSSTSLLQVGLVCFTHENAFIIILCSI